MKDAKDYGPLITRLNATVENMNAHRMPANEPLCITRDEVDLMVEFVKDASFQNEPNMKTIRSELYAGTMKFNGHPIVIV